MKKVRLNDLENNKNDKLKQYKLDKDSINEFRSKIKQVSDEESNKLSNEVIKLIFNNDFNDNYEKVLELLFKGANIEKYLHDKCLFNVCLEKKYMKTLFVLLRSGININLSDNQFLTPLMVCSKAGNKEILELLILMGADVNLKNVYGDTALSIAIKNNHKECIDLLMNAQTRFNFESSESNLNNKYNQSSVDDQPMSLIKEVEDKFCSIVEDQSMNLIKEEELLNTYNNHNLTNEIKFDLLSIEQIISENRLDLFDIYGIKCDITDFAILLGGCVLSKGNSKKNRTGWWWTKSLDKLWCGHVNYIGTCRHSCTQRLFECEGGVRPVLPYSSIQSISSNRARGVKGIKKIIYGEYPQTIIGENFSHILEMAYRKEKLRITEKKYRKHDKYQDSDTFFRTRNIIEYEYIGRKYIRFFTDEYCGRDSSLSDGRSIEPFKIYWVRVEPITWLVDERSNIALSEKIILSGIPFNYSFRYDGVFEHSFMYKYLNEIFAKDIVPSKVNNKQLIKKLW